MGPHWKDGEGWMQEGNFDPTRAALPAYSQTHTQARSLKSCLKTHSSCWDTRIAENRHMSEAMKELSVLKHFSFHTEEVFSNTSQGSVREKSCHREGSVWNTIHSVCVKVCWGLPTHRDIFNTAGGVDTAHTKLCKYGSWVAYITEYNSWSSVLSNRNPGLEWSIL